MKFLMKYLCDGAIIFFSFLMFVLGLKESSCFDKRGGELEAGLVLLEGAVCRCRGNNGLLSLTAIESLRAFILPLGSA
jgi:hypothetical protein